MTAVHPHQQPTVVSSSERLNGIDPSAFVRLFVAVLMFAALLGGGAFQQAQAAELVPFQGTFNASVRSFAPCPPSFCVVLDGTGQARHLGQTEIVKETASTPTGGTCANGAPERTYVATITLTAANGDTLTMSGAGTICEGPGGAVAEGTYTVTGGTGRFSGATGTVSERLTGIAPSLQISLSGSISSPGAAK